MPGIDPHIPTLATRTRIRAIRYSGKDRRGFVAYALRSTYNAPMAILLLPIRIAARSLSNPTSMALPALMSMGAENVGHLAADS